MTSEQAVERLTHHHAESRKCVADYYRFRCDCGDHPALEHDQLTGFRALTCHCGFSVRFNFAVAIGAVGSPPDLDPDPWGAMIVK